MNATLLQINRQARSGRLVGLERDYQCPSCRSEHLSWSKLQICPCCGHRLSSAKIRRAALA